MAIEVVFTEADEWLTELVEDAGNIDRGLARVTVSTQPAADRIMSTVLVSAGYSVGGVAVRLERRIGQRFTSDFVGDLGAVVRTANAEAERIEEAVRAMGLEVRHGRLVTVG